MVNDLFVEMTTMKELNPEARARYKPPRKHEFTGFCTEVTDHGDIRDD